MPLPGQSTTTPENRAEKGLAVQKQIIGSDAVENIYASAPGDQQHIQRYLAANCFGDHYTCTGIGVPTRELLAFSMLAALGGCKTLPLAWLSRPRMKFAQVKRTYRSEPDRTAPGSLPSAYPVALAS